MMVVFVRMVVTKCMNLDIYVFGYAVATGYYRSDSHRVFVYFLEEIQS